MKKIIALLIGLLSPLIFVVPPAQAVTCGADRSISGVIEKNSVRTYVLVWYAHCDDSYGGYIANRGGYASAAWTDSSDNYPCSGAFHLEYVDFNPYRWDTNTVDNQIYHRLPCEQDGFMSTSWPGTSIKLRESQSPRWKFDIKVAWDAYPDEGRVISGTFP